MLARSWRFGATTTTTLDRTHRSEIKHLQKRAGRLSNLRAPRPARLPKLTTKNMKTRPADSRYERGSLGGQVITLKAHLRRIGARTFTDMFAALAEICDLFSPEECWNYFKAAGYVSG